MLDADQLTAALATGNPADEASRHELLRGTQIQGPSPPGPVANFLGRYSERIERWRTTGIRFVGDDALERLAGSGYDEVRIVGVHGNDDFVVFLAPEEDSVVATLGVDGAAPGQFFER